LRVAARLLEDSRRILKQLPLPAIEDVQVQFQLVAQVGDRNLVHQMPLENGHLLLGSVVLSFSTHGKPSSEVLC